MRRKTLLIGFLAMLFTTVKAQVYVDNKSQHRFAQTYIGLNTQIVPSSGKLFWNDQSYKFPSQVAPRFTIGGLHFWGKWDFNINFPLTYFSDRRIAPETDVILETGGDLSARYYPFRMLYGKLRPYAGISINEMILDLENETAGERADLFITSSLIGGFSYAFNGWQVNTEIMWMPNNQRDFYSSRTAGHTFELPKAYFSLGLIKYFEGTLKNERDKLSGKTEKLEKQFDEEGILNSFSLAIAPSGSYFLAAPEYSNAARVSLPRHKGTFNWDFGLGYLFHNANIHVGLSYRDYTSGVESYNRVDLIRRRSLAVEAFKYVWNFHGFAPYIGPSIGLEKWASAQFEGDEQIGATQRTNIVSPGILFGWDILASPLETWLLRTNLRYYPFQKVKDAEGNIARVDQFEFNFIQLVIYPNRMINFKGRR
ncbi:hypothetical protein [Marivirga atlantica]|jgi:hypothetical protein|uniref:Uncharacterized protein n=1 Tax=Marivirga atlantica TaxID=1548457 RepID=A0A937AJU0_9BACT|nr:hypothetical protein [Marivirga atlantica]MBL0764022.1 hypothetical protein [Marivirga atlantica]